MNCGAIQYPEVMAVLWYVILGMLASYGLLCALWALFGWILPDGEGCALCCVGMPEEGTLRRYRWLKNMGLLKVPLLVIAEEAQPVWEETEICSREELLSRLERERKKADGTGTGDSPGRSQRCGVSEL